MGTWIEIFYHVHIRKKEGGRSLRGNVDRNSELHAPCYAGGGRSLRGNVDRNTMILISRPSQKKSFPTWERG